MLNTDPSALSVYAMTAIAVGAKYWRVQRIAWIKHVLMLKPAPKRKSTPFWKHNFSFKNFYFTFDIVEVDRWQALLLAERSCLPSIKCTAIPTWKSTSDEILSRARLEIRRWDVCKFLKLVCQQRHIITCTINVSISKSQVDKSKVGT